MGQYLLNLTEEEKNNILDKHKTIYNGFSVKQNSNNTQPLYVMDFANDKNGITVNNQGIVSTYKNVGINEAVDLDVIENEDSEQYEKVDYLGVEEEPKKVKDILDDIESDVEFKEDSDKIKESVIDTLKWFKKII